MSETCPTCGGETKIIEWSPTDYYGPSVKWRQCVTRKIRVEHCPGERRVSNRRAPQDGEAVEEVATTLYSWYRVGLEKPADFHRAPEHVQEEFRDQARKLLAALAALPQGEPRKLKMGATALDQRLTDAAAKIRRLEAELAQLRAEPDDAEREALAKLDAAMDMVGALCQPKGTEGSREWIMSIPARPDYDPDIVIADALVAARDLLRARPAVSGDVEAARRLMLYAAQTLPMTPNTGRPGDFPTPEENAGCAIRGALNALDGKEAFPMEHDREAALRTRAQIVDHLAYAPTGRDEPSGRCESCGALFSEVEGCGLCIGLKPAKTTYRDRVLAEAERRAPSPEEPE